MKYEINFNELPKSKYKLYLGYFSLSFSLILLYYSIQTLQTLPGLYFIFFFVQGISSLVEGKGKSINSFWGERFLRIDDEKIEYKLKSRKPATIIYWDDVENIEFSTSKVIIKVKGKDEEQIEYGEFSYSSVQKLKESINSIAKTKGILQ